MSTSKTVKQNPPGHLYEAFAECWENPTRENFRQTLASHIGEKDFLDFKMEWPEFPVLAKHIIAMGNSFGGSIVIGIKEGEGSILSPVGIPSIRDTADITKGIEKYLPLSLLKCIDIIPFTYTASEYEALKGKSFQMVKISPDVEHTPFVSRKAGTGIIADAIYVRRGTRTEIANHDELQEILNRRIETRYSTSKEITLEEHLGQLKILYSQIPTTLAHSPALGRFLSGLLLPKDILTGVSNPEYPQETFTQFVIRCIERKKSRIESDLGV